MLVTCCLLALSYPQNHPVLIDVNKRFTFNHGGTINCLAWDPKGVFLISGGKQGVIIWNVLQKKESHKVGVKESNSVLSVDFSRSGKEIAYICGGRVIITKNDPMVKDLKWFETNSFIYEVRFTAADDLICYTSGKDIVFWSIANRKEQFTLRGHKAAVGCLDLSLDYKLLASGSSDYTVIIWDVIGAKKLCILGGHSVGVQSVAFSPDGKQIAATDGFDVALWDIEHRKRIKKLEGHTKPIGAVAFHPKGKYLVSGCDNGEIRIWEAKNGKLIQVVKELKKGFNVKHLRFSPDGKLLAVSQWDGTISLLPFLQ